MLRDGSLIALMLLLPILLLSGMLLGIAIVGRRIATILQEDGRPPLVIGRHRYYVVSEEEFYWLRASQHLRRGTCRLP